MGVIEGGSKFKQQVVWILAKDTLHRIFPAYQQLLSGFRTGVDMVCLVS